MAGELIYTEGLTEMHIGNASIGVPLINNIIQINSFTDDGNARLHVEKNRQGVNIFREDGDQIQVNVRNSVRLDTYPWNMVLEAQIFDEPVEKIVLQPYPKIVDGWRMSPEMPTCNRDAATSFLAKVGEYALIKQEAYYRQLPLVHKLIAATTGRRYSN